MTRTFHPETASMPPQNNKTIYIYSRDNGQVNTDLIAAAVTVLTKQPRYFHLQDISQYLPDSQTRLLVIDGTAGQEAIQDAKAAGIKEDYHLTVRELGIEHRNGTPLKEEDLQLIMDAVEACCTTPDLSPKFNCPCCG